MDAHNFSDDYISMLHARGANTIILKWIRNMHRGFDPETGIVVPEFFKEHSYYFALLLSDVFPGGEICRAHNFDDIVYVYNGVAYDIDGVTHVMSDYFVPVKALGAYVYKYRDIPGMYLSDLTANLAEYLDNPSSRIEALSFYNIANSGKEN